MIGNKIIKALDNLHDRILGDKSFLANVTHGELYALFHAKRILELQQAEIERLKIRNKTLTAITKHYDWKFEKAKSEAIKEFADRLKEKGHIPNEKWNTTKEKAVYESDIDNLVKEMAGE